MNKSIFVTIVSLIFPSFLSAQIVTNVELLATFTAPEISATIGFLRTAEFDVDIYKVNYMTPDVNGDMSEASGIICIPKDETRAFPLASYQHGTVAGREDVPSRLESDNYILPLIFAGAGFVTCSADYLGLGDSPGIHPYVHAATEASACLDLMRAAVELSQDPSFNLFLNDQVFLAGYSQGGHSTMALQRSIELDPSQEFNLTASAPMSGPYSISESMVEFTLGDEPYSNVSYIAWVTLSYQIAYPETVGNYSLEGVFKDGYLQDVIEFRDENINLWELESRLRERLIQETGMQRVKDMLFDSIVNGINSDPTHPFSEALADNDTYDWAPSKETMLCYCHGDEQVTFENSLLAERVMKDNGSDKVELVRMDTDAAPLTHSGCAIPCHLEVYDRFSALRVLLSNTEEITDAARIAVFPNEKSIVVNTNDAKSGSEYKIAMYNVNGQLIREETIQGESQIIYLYPEIQGLHFYTIMDQNFILQSGKISSSNSYSRINQ